MKIKTVILMMLILCSSVIAQDWSVNILGNQQRDFAIGVGKIISDGNAEIGIGGAVYSVDGIDSESDYTVGPYLSMRFDIPGNPFDNDITTFIGLSPQIDLDSKEPLLEFFAGGIFNPERKVTPIFGAKYNWVTNLIEDKTDIIDGLYIYGGMKFRF